MISKINVYVNDYNGIGSVDTPAAITFSEKDNQLSVENGKLILDDGQGNKWKVVVLTRYGDIKQNLKNEYSMNDFRNASRKHPGSLWRESADVISMFENMGGRDISFSSHKGMEVGFIDPCDQIVEIDMIASDDWVFRNRKLMTLNAIVERIKTTGEFPW